MRRLPDHAASCPIALWPAHYTSMIPADMEVHHDVLHGVLPRFTACSVYVVQPSCSLVVLTFGARITSKCTSVVAILPKQHSMLPNSVNRILSLDRPSRESRPDGRGLIFVFIIFWMAMPFHHLVSISCDPYGKCQCKNY